jgi:16S rRNA (uracil1498-N3)-methyltransferase
MERCIVPYEDARGISHARDLVKGLHGVKSIGIYIGPEGGFDESEIEQAKEAGFEIMTLGKRILRTETAGLAILSILMFELEE